MLEATERGGRSSERWCLGDVVGYGAQPDDCAALAAERCELCLVGNHDLAVTGEIDTEVFSASAAAAVEWTRENCKPETIEFLKGLKPAGDRQGGRPLPRLAPRPGLGVRARDRPGARSAWRSSRRRVSLIGHSHVALYFSDAGRTRARPAARRPTGHEIDLAEGRWLLNPGSVGQPRDGDPRAAWLELDTEEWKATYHRVEYDIDRAADAIREAGLPDLLAERLYGGPMSVRRPTQGA